MTDPFGVSAMGVNVMPREESSLSHSSSSACVATPKAKWSSPVREFIEAIRASGGVLPHVEEPARFRVSQDTKLDFLTVACQCDLHVEQYHSALRSASVTVKARGDHL